MGWVASFHGPASIGCNEMLAAWARKPASILLQKMLAKFEIMLESGTSKHVKMENAGWMGWMASFFLGQPAMVVLTCWLD